MAGSSTIGSFFIEAVPQTLAEDKLTISLPKDWGYIADLLSGSRPRPLISGAFESVFGRAIDYQFVTSGTTAPASGDEAAENTPADAAGADEQTPSKDSGSSGDPAKRSLVAEAARKLKGRIVTQDRGSSHRRKGG